MSRPLRILLARFLVLGFLANVIGVGTMNAFAASSDQHGPAAAESVAADGTAHDEPGSSGCNHSCHFAQHFFAPVSESSAPVAGVSSYATPMHSAVTPASIRQKAPFHPPRALA